VLVENILHFGAAYDAESGAPGHRFGNHAADPHAR
jgi:hypothetical protein